MVIPSALLRKFYQRHSLQNLEHGFEFQLKNRVAPATLIAFGPVEVDGEEYPPHQLTIIASKPRSATHINAKTPLPLGLGKQITIQIEATPLASGPHQIYIHAMTKEVGPMIISIEDTL